MGAFALPISVALIDESGVKQRLDDVAERMMDDSISKGRGADFAAFGFADVKMAVRAGAIGARAEFVPQRDQVIRYLMFKGCCRDMPAFPFGGFTKGPVLAINSFWRGDADSQATRW